MESVDAKRFVAHRSMKLRAIAEGAKKEDQGLGQDEQDEQDRPG